MAGLVLIGEFQSSYSVNNLSTSVQTEIWNDDFTLDGNFSHDLPDADYAWGVALFVVENGFCQNT